MKKLRLYGGGVSFLAIAFAAVSLLPAQVNASGTGHLPLYRLRNATSGEHFYTMDAAEADSALLNNGYVFEGVAGYLDTASSSSTVPLYRLEAQYAGHFYTTSQSEANSATSNYAFTNEGTTGYIATDAGNFRTPLYRLRTVGTNQHFYTTSRDESNNAVAHGGYVLEGTAGYVYTQP